MLAQVLEYLAQFGEDKVYSHYEALDFEANSHCFSVEILDYKVWKEVYAWLSEHCDHQSDPEVSWDDEWFFNGFSVMIYNDNEDQSKMAGITIIW